MAIILRSRVDIMDGATRIGMKPAVMDLHDDGRFVLATIELTTGNIIQMVIDTAVHNLSVNGATTYLAITAGDMTKKVDFSGETPPVLAIGLGVLGMELSRVSAEKAGIKDWVAAFKQYGVFRGFGIDRRNLIVLIIVGAVVIGAIVALSTGMVAF